MNLIPELEVVRSATQIVRADPVENGMPEMEVRFSPFGVWYEIDSFWEGRFLERTVRGAFSKTIKESGDRVRSLFNHGYDPQIGDKVLGSIEDLREDSDSAVGLVRLFDTTYVRELLPGLEAGQYGSSMRMRVVKEEWNEEPDPAEHNPTGIPERTILEVRLFEFGPVTWPANTSATATVRSGTDDFYERLRARDPRRVDELERARSSRTLPGQAAGTATADRGDAADTTTDEPASRHSGGLTRAQRARLITMRKEM
jgi:HK97 family phage prohead protease